MCRGNVLGELEGDGVLSPPVASSQDERRLLQTQKEIRLVKESAHVVLGIVADEIVRDGDVCRHAHRVLNVEFLQDNYRQSRRHQTHDSIATYSLGYRGEILIIRAAINPDAREVRRGVHIRAIRLEEALEVGIVRVVPEETRHRKRVVLVRRCRGRDPV